MSADATVEARSPFPQFFLAQFVSLAVLAGATIGMGNVITTLYALHLGATAFQVGLISGAASFGMILMTLPAGFLIARFGARRVYFLASLGSLAVYLIVPWLKAWPLLAAARWLVGLCIPFRTVSMNSSFLRRIRTLGPTKAGWYRAAQATGLALVGPWLGNYLIESSSFLVSYICLAAFFGFMGVYAQSVLPDPEDADQDKAVAGEGLLTQIRFMLRDVWVAESCLTEFVSHSTVALFTTFIIVLAVREIHLAQHEAVLLISIQGVSSVCALLLFGHLLKHAPLWVSYAGSVVLAVTALTLLGTSHDIPRLALGAVSLSAAAALIHLVNVMRLASSAISKSKIAGFINLAGLLGSLTGSVAGGFLSGYVGVQNLYLLWIPFVVATAGVCVLRARTLKTEAAP